MTRLLQCNQGFLLFLYLCIKTEPKSVDQSSQRNEKCVSLIRNRKERNENRFSRLKWQLQKEFEWKCPPTFSDLKWSAGNFLQLKLKTFARPSVKVNIKKQNNKSPKCRHSMWTSPYTCCVWFFPLCFIVKCLFILL